MLGGANLPRNVAEEGAGGKIKIILCLKYSADYWAKEKCVCAPPASSLIYARRRWTCGGLPSVRGQKVVSTYFHTPGAFARNSARADMELIPSPFASTDHIVHHDPGPDPALGLDLDSEIIAPGESIHSNTRTVAELL
ncbi:hypothetical protein EVAR_13734_1 [Eumeta japonica]|uniref:Uncharacterized protein n=1 Tax=Eumeta variegata TaxID=151549 RepID=A0A4C1UCC7_EUMVA|nr:hypothetical protein EVAR_13734_1 [Eumeta japonica]